MSRRPTPVTATNTRHPYDVHHFKSLREAVSAGGFNHTAVSRCLRNPKAIHCGYTFTTTSELTKPRATKRHEEIRTLAAKGHSFALIAHILKISRSTVCYHMRAPL